MNRRAKLSLAGLLQRIEALEAKVKRLEGAERHLGTSGPPMPNPSLEKQNHAAYIARATKNTLNT